MTVIASNRHLPSKQKQPNFLYFGGLKLDQQVAQFLIDINNYHIILNGNMNYEAQCSTFTHEIKHIITDMPTIGYIIGIDMQYEYFETKTNITGSY